MPFLAPAIAVIGSAIASAATAAAVGAETVALALGVSGAAALTLGAAVEAIVPAAIEFGAVAALSALTSPRPKVNTAGSPQSFKADPLAPYTVVMTRYGVGGGLVYETTSGGASKAEHGAAGNEYLTQFVVLGALGPYGALESTQLDDTVLTFGGESCTGGYVDSSKVQNYNPGYKLNANGSYQNDNFKDHVWQTYFAGAQEGPTAAVAMPYPSKIAGVGDNLPEWDNAHGLAGHAAVAITRSYDTSTWAGGPGQPLWTLAQGHPVWDPRKDSTFAGGNGPQRSLDGTTPLASVRALRATWAPSDNPIIHALNYAIGHYLPSADGTGVGRFGGVGAGVAGVDVAAFVRAANVADANGWKITGQWSSGDGKRSVLVAMLQAGGAQLVSDCGRISCVVSTPLTAVNANAPITWADLAGDATLDTTGSVRERINTAYVRYTSEAHRWQVVQADSAVEAETYVDEDGGFVRSKTIELPYVPNVDQASQLAAYAIADGREIPNIVLPGKPHLRGYRVGDCIEVDLPELGLHTTKLVVTKRSTDPLSAVVTLTCRTETDAKHDFALGRSGVAPPTPGISGFDPTIVPAPLPGSWTATAVGLGDGSGAMTHIIRIDGVTIDNVYALDVVVLYAQVTTDEDGDDVTGPIASTTFPASQLVCDLSLPAGRWHIWLRYRTISGAESPENTLDLGVFVIDGPTVTYIAPDVYQQIIDNVSAAVTLTDDAIAEALAKFGDDGEDENAAALINLTQGLASLQRAMMQLGPGGLPLGPFLKEVQTLGADTAETLSIMAERTADGQAVVLHDDFVQLSNGQFLADYTTAVQASLGANAAAVIAEATSRATADSTEAQSRVALAATLGALSSTVQDNYLALTTADSTEATARTALASDYNGFKSDASTQLLTLATNTSSLSASLTQLSSDFGGFKSSASSSLATLTTNLQATTTSVTTLQSTYGGLSSTVSVQAAAIATLQGRTAAYLTLTVDSGTGRAFVGLAADSQSGSNIFLMAGRIYFGGSTYFDDATKTLQTRYAGRAKVTGPGFGSAGQFIEWWGPDVPLASMTESNALMYMSTAGTGFFAGGVLSGTTQAQGAWSQNNSPGNGAIVATTSTLIKRGGSVKIDIGLSIYMSSIQTGARNTAYTNGGSTACSVTAQAVRSSDGSNWTAFGGQYTIPGSIAYEWDTETSKNSWTGGINGSFSVADTPADGNYFYGVKIIGFSSGGTPATPQPFSVQTFATNNRG